MAVIGRGIKQGIAESLAQFLSLPSQAIIAIGASKDRSWRTHARLQRMGSDAVRMPLDVTAL